jgi:hypothetical protein
MESFPYFWRTSGTGAWGNYGQRVRENPRGDRAEKETFEL